MNDLKEDNIEDTKELTIEQLLAKIEHPKKRLFLENYCTFANTKKTAVAIGLAGDTPYQWIVRDNVFRSALSAVKKKIDTDRLEEIEAEIHNRAMGGTSKQSDILLMFEAKALDPNKYREKPQAIPLTGEITVIHKIPRPGYKQLKESNGQEGTDQTQSTALQREESVTE